MQTEKIDRLQKDLTKKNEIVEAHYKSIANSNEKVGLMAYELSDAIKLMNEAELKSNTNLKANFEITMVNTDLNKQIQDLKNELANRETEF